MFVEHILPGARERLVTIAEGAPLTEAARLLGEARSGLVVVCDGDGRMVGVASKTDIVRRIATCLGHACTTRVAEVMARDVAFCRPGDRLKDAWATMKERGRHELPVVDDAARPLGVVSARQALEALLGEVEHEETLLRDYVLGIGYR